jgi:chromosome segregation protein
MYLKTLEISGFKSFAKKTKLEFSSSITTIVGPNGSGKSNVVESIRFVLGEQSIKSLRGKMGSDLIFKGSKSTPKSNRASVSICFDNSSKIFSLAGRGDKEINLDFDEVVITREVYSDGVNRYLINNSEVRLKDILEMLSSVNIGSSGHHIISQGEADRILNASLKERKGMIEDALGLKIYQYRIKESERKFEKTKENIKEVGSLRREIAPHINFLKKQVEKIEKASILKDDLRKLYREYLKKEEDYLNREKEKLSGEKSELNGKLKQLDLILEKEKIEIEVKKHEGPDEKQIELEKVENKIKEFRTFKDELSRKLGRIEGMIELEERRLNSKDENKKENIPLVSVKEIELLVSQVNDYLDEALSKNEIREVFNVIQTIKSLVKKFVPEREKVDNLELEQKRLQGEEVEKMRNNKKEILAEFDKLAEEEGKLFQTASFLRKEIEIKKEKEREDDRMQFEISMRRKELFSEKSVLDIKEENLNRIEFDFNTELHEAAILIGRELLAYKDFVYSEDEENSVRSFQEDRKKKIERIKVRLEDIGIGGGSDIMKEYTEAVERDNFLAKETEDLVKSMESLNEIITDLKQKLEEQFRDGIKKINEQFQIFFSLMFDGGNANLMVVEQKKKIKKDEEVDLENYEEEESGENEIGIDINVSLPKKKVKELSMLSGGERSLTSIALLFSISQVNPPPFLVLDETDAALDESNSRKYGDMLENLSKCSQLIVVTHNRETMSRAHILYGVTLGSDDSSKLLSVKFDEAVAIAK